VGVESRYLEVVTADGGKALNHFNKAHKGELVRDLVGSQPSLPTPESFRQWAGVVGLSVTIGESTITLAV
jgi:hypothetical protein